MTQARFTDLPTVSNASLTDIICAVQGYMSPSVLGTSVQETLAQVLDLFSANLGNATAESITFSPTTKGIEGTTNADNASTGFVGEYITSNVPSGSGISLTTTTAANITSINLTAGDWDVFGNITFDGVGVTNPIYIGWSSMTSATVPDSSLYARDAAIGSTINLGEGITIPLLRVNVSMTTTIYLSAQAFFSVGTVTAFGSIFARRVR